MRSMSKTHAKTAPQTTKLEDDFIVLGHAEIQSRKGKCYNFVTTPRWSDRATSGFKQTRPMVLRVTERERATILAALRRWLSYPAAREADLTATDRGKLKPLDDGEIQRLCQRLNETVRKGNGTPSYRHSNNSADIQKPPKLRDD